MSLRLCQHNVSLFHIYVFIVLSFVVSPACLVYAHLNYLLFNYDEMMMQI
jgi:hypothetical protein